MNETVMQDNQSIASHDQVDGHEGGQQHPIGIYLKIWALLFILSAMSYSVDYYHLQGYLRWSLIIIFMLLKAGLIVSVFMHLMWERMAVILLILLPPGAILVLIALMSLEADYTFLSRMIFYDR